MLANSVKVTGESDEYTLARVGNKYYISGTEVIQKTYRQFDDDEKEDYKEQRQNGYSKEEALFIVNLKYYEPFDDLADSYMNIVMLEIFLLMLHSDDRILGKNILYRDITENEEISINLKYGGKQVTFRPEESFRTQIIKLIE